MFDSSRKKSYWVIKFGDRYMAVNGSSAMGVGPGWAEEHRDIVHQSADPMRDWLAHLDSIGEFIERSMKENAKKRNGAP